MIDLGLIFEKLLSEVFGRIKLHKKKNPELEIYIFFT